MLVPHFKPVSSTVTVEEQADLPLDNANNYEVQPNTAGVNPSNTQSEAYALEQGLTSNTTY